MRFILLLFALCTCVSCYTPSKRDNHVNQTQSDYTPLFYLSEIEDSLMLFLKSCDSVSTDVLNIREYLVDFDINAKGDTILTFAAADEFLPSNEMQFTYDNGRKCEVAGGFMIEGKSVLIRRVKDFPIKHILRTETLDLALGEDLDRRNSTDYVQDGPMIATYKVYKLINCDSLHLLEHRHIGRRIYYDLKYNYPIFL